MTDGHQKLSVLCDQHGCCMKLHYCSHPGGLLTYLLSASRRKFAMVSGLAMSTSSCAVICSHRPPGVQELQRDIQHMPQLQLRQCCVLSKGTNTVGGSWLMHAKPLLVSMRSSQNQSSCCPIQAGAAALLLDCPAAWVCAEPRTATPMCADCSP